MGTKTYITADDLLAMAEDGQRRELVKGEVRSMAPAGGEHGRNGARLLVLLGTYVVQHGLGEVFAAETGFRVERSPDTVLAPDVSFLTRERWESLERPEAYIDGAPDLAAEVVSPSDSSEEVHEKALRWLEAGVRLLWVVHPRRQTVTVYTPDRRATVLGLEDTLDGGDVVPGFSLPIQQLFE